MPEGGAPSMIALGESTPNSEERLHSAIGEVLFNVSNFPERAQARLLGQDMAPLRRKIADAVLAAGYRRQEDWEQLRIDQHWPTPRNMHRTADALDQLCVAKYGDVLRYVAELCEPVPVTEEGTEHATDL